MKRKLFTSILALAAFTLVFGTSALAAGTEPMTKEQLNSLTEEQAQERATQLTQRVNEIKDMKRNELSKEDRQEVKKELREIKKELDFLNNKLTLSVGAVIIIVLLIILIF